MTLQEFNALPETAAFKDLERCCGSSTWVRRMVSLRPFNTLDSLYTKADGIWTSLTERDWKEAFTHHPKIGDVESLKKKFAATSTWAEGEQRGVQNASDETIRRLAAENNVYENKFGYIFIVCATGKQASEMLGILRSRLANDPKEEIIIAAEEQRKITRIRLEKLFSSPI